MPPLKPQAERTARCKICGGDSPLCGVVDMEKSCAQRTGPPRQLSGIPIYYHRCLRCGLLFTAAFDQWGPEDFIANIYNNQYSEVDPEDTESRPAENAVFMAGVIENPAAIRMLDYGSVNGRFAELMRLKGVDCQSWNPLADTTRRPIAGAFDIVTAFEVFAHSPDPLTHIAEAISFLRPGGLLVFSTLTLPPDMKDPCGIWYVAPRNGHITIFTELALAHVAHSLGLKLEHLNQTLHIAWTLRPS